MTYWTILDENDYAIEEIYSDIQPPSSVPFRVTSFFVRAKFNHSTNEFYEGATTQEIDNYIEGVIAQTHVNLVPYGGDITICTTLNRPMPDYVSSLLMGILQEEQNLILHVRPEYEFNTHNLPVLDFKYRTVIEEDATSFVIPMLIWHKGINELYINDLIIETVPFDLPTKTVGVSVKAGDRIRITYK